MKDNAESIKRRHRERRDKYLFIHLRGRALKGRRVIRSKQLVGVGLLCRGPEIFHRIQLKAVNTFQNKNPDIKLVINDIWLPVRKTAAKPTAATPTFMLNSAPTSLGAAADEISEVAAEVPLPCFVSNVKSSLCELSVGFRLDTAAVLLVMGDYNI